MKKIKSKKSILIVLLTIMVVSNHCYYRPSANLHDDPNHMLSVIALKQSSMDILNNYDFGSILVNTSKSVTFSIKNMGNVKLDLTGNPVVALSDSTYFTLTQAPQSSLAPKGTSNFIITFNPGAISGIQRSADVTIQNTSNNQKNFVFTVTGIASANPEASILVQAESQTIDVNGNYQFGDVKSGTMSNWVTFTITNNGTGPLTLSNLTLNGSNFEKTDPLSFSVSPGASTTFTVRFKPASEGVFNSDYVTFTHNAANKTSPYRINLLGNSVLPHIDILNGASSITSYDFGNVKSGLTSSILTLTIKNNGAYDLNLTGSPLCQLIDANSQFEILTQPSSLIVKNGGTSTFNVVFKPTSTGTKTAQIKIYHDGVETNPYVITLNGNGTVADSPKLEVLINSIVYSNNSTYDFGKKKSGTSSPELTITLKNTGTGSLTLTGSPYVLKSATTEFSITQPSAASISPNGGTITFMVIFNPTSVGANKTAILEIQNDDSSSNPYYLNLKGEGTLYDVPQISVTREDSSTHIWYNVAENSTYDYGLKTSCTNQTNFKIKNIGTVNISNLSVASSNFLKFIATSVSSTSLSLNQEATFTLNYCPPIDSGTYTSIITLDYKDPASISYQFKFNVKGTR